MDLRLVEGDLLDQDVEVRVAFGGAEAVVPSGLKVDDVTVGLGATAERGSTVSIRWRGTLNRGDEFGSGEISFRVGERSLIAGLEMGVVGMRVGGTRRLKVSPHLGYRDQAVPGIPANAVLVFTVDLLGVCSPES